MNTEKNASKYYLKLTVFINDHRCLRKRQIILIRVIWGLLYLLWVLIVLHETHLFRITLNKIHISKISAKYVYENNYAHKYIVTYEITSVSNPNKFSLMLIPLWDLSLTHVLMWLDILLTLKSYSFFFFVVMLCCCCYFFPLKYLVNIQRVDAWLKITFLSFYSFHIEFWRKQMVSLIGKNI